MSRNQKIFSAIGLTVFGLLLIFSLAYSQGQGMMGSGMWMGNHQGWWNANVPQQYWLSSEQISKISAIRQKYDNKILPLRQKLMALIMETRGYSAQPDANINKIKDYQKQIRKLQAKIDNLRSDARAEINKVLTKGQRAYYGDYAFGNWWTGNMGMHGMMMNGSQMHMMRGSGMPMMNGAGMNMMGNCPWY